MNEVTNSLDASNFDESDSNLLLNSRKRRISEDEDDSFLIPPSKKKRSRKSGKTDSLFPSTSEEDSRQTRGVKKILDEEDELDEEMGDDKMYENDEEELEEELEEEDLDEEEEYNSKSKRKSKAGRNLKSYSVSPIRRSERARKSIDYYDLENGDDFRAPKKPKKTLPSSSQIDFLLGDRFNKETLIREYYVKWKLKSYLHCEWVPEERVMQDSTGKARLTRYWQRKEKKDFTDEKEEYFPPEYCEVDRVISEKQVPTESGPKPMYLVKWKTLPYTDATWENPETIKDDRKINFFHHINKIPPHPTFPPQQKWVELKESPVYSSFQGTNKNLLRPYQLEGLNWLAFCWYERKGSILADEMGLGKTVQSISFLVYLRTFENLSGPFLVVAPLSTLGHWIREFEEWTDFNVVLYQGNQENRDLIRDYEFYYPSDKGKSKKLKFNVLLTTYEMILSADWSEIQQIDWKVLIVDEAQRLKNCSSKLIQHLRQFKTSHKILLTGTPIQNNTQELWTLLNFIEPQKFGDMKSFLNEFGELQDSSQVSKLHSVLKPHLLRRMKEDVEKSIPPKEETLIEVELTSLQKQYYRAILEKNREFLNKGCTNRNFPHLLNIMMQLRKLCNHPFLVNGVEEKETSGKVGTEYFQTLIDSCGKMVLLDKLLPKLKEGGHKVLIFSQMIRVLNLLESYLQYKGYIYERLDGGIRGNERQSAIDRFCKPGSDRFVFLLCTRAGGLGINLTAADTVIIYDSDWNPQNDIQAQARCHRIGQTSEVKVYRLITAKTYERHMFEKASKKLGLDQAVLSDMGASGENKNKLDKSEIDSLLKYGAYDIFTDEENEKFKEEDIDQILNKSSKVIWSADKKEETGESSSFSKASFQSSKADSKIELDDPNFWEKVLPEAKSAEKLYDRLNKGKVVTPEQRENFLRDLGDLVSEVLTNFRDGYTELVSSGRTGLTKIFNHPAIAHFSDIQQMQIARWNEEVSKPRRERKSTARFGMVSGLIDFSSIKNSNKNLISTTLTNYNNFNNNNNNTTINSSTNLVNSPPPATDFVFHWNERERRRFHNAFMAFGPYRLPSIRQAAFLSNRPLEECQKYAEEFVKQLIIHSDEQDRKVFVECLETLLISDPNLKEVEVELKPEFTKFIKRKLKSWGRQLRFLTLLHYVFSYYEDRLDQMRIPNIDRTLTSWWTTQEDRSLLLGIYRHGLGNYEAIKLDQSLSFFSHLNDIGEITTSLSIKENQEKEEKEEEEEEEKEEKEEIEDKEENEEMEDPEAAELENNGTLSSNAISNNLNHNSSNVETNKGEGKPTKTKSASWPNSRSLEIHARLLLEAMKRKIERKKLKQLKQKDKASKKHKLKEEKKRQKEEARNKTQEKHKDWSKRELHEFRLALLIYGGGVWDLIREKGSIRKTDEQMEEQYDLLVQEAKELLKNSNSENNSNELADNEDQEEDSSKSKSDSSSLKGTLTLTIARKLLKRLQLFDDIRNQVLKHPELTVRLQKAQTSDLPDWWFSPLHDRVLLEAFAKFGLSTTDWEQFIQDEQCILYLNDEHKPEFTQEKYNYLANFIAKEKTVLIRRLEELRTCVLNPENFESSKKKKDKKRKPPEESRVFIPEQTRIQETQYPRKKSKTTHFLTDASEDKILIKDVKRDENGQPILPIFARGASILSLGTIVYDRPAFHSKGYIFPVGFKSVRKLPSPSQPDKLINYYSEILDGGNAPIFKVTAQNNEISFTEATSSGVWCTALCKIKKRDKVSVSGPEMYGYSDNLIKMLIQELPNAKECKNYQWKEFEIESNSNNISSSVPINNNPTINVNDNTFFEDFSNKMEENKKESFKLFSSELAEKKENGSILDDSIEVVGELPSQNRSSIGGKQPFLLGMGKKPSDFVKERPSVGGKQPFLFGARSAFSGKSPSFLKDQLELSNQQFDGLAKKTQSSPSSPSSSPSSSSSSSSESENDEIEI